LDPETVLPWFGLLLKFFTTSNKYANFLQLTALALNSILKVPESTLVAPTLNRCSDRLSSWRVGH
jgi:hypothetical protein